MLQIANQRSTRSFSFYRGSTLVLSVDDRPGAIQSTATPAPGGPPLHPFVNARAFDPVSEGELAALLASATGFDSFVTLLIGAGFDAASNDGSPPVGRGRCFRVEDGAGLVGALWEGRGQFTSLWLQPREHDLVFGFATLTAYRADRADVLLEAVRGATTFDGLRARLEAEGLHLRPVGGPPAAS